MHDGEYPKPRKKRRMATKPEPGHKGSRTPQTEGRNEKKKKVKNLSTSAHAGASKFDPIDQAASDADKNKLIPIHGISPYDGPMEEVKIDSLNRKEQVPGVYGGGRGASGPTWSKKQKSLGV